MQVCKIAAICKRLFFVCFALAVLRFPDSLSAQFTDPRTYDNTPVGVNQLELAYAYARSNASVDTSLIVAGAKLSLNAGTIDCTRYFGFIHRLAWVEATVPLANLGGSVTGTNIQGSSTGAGDSSYQLAVLLKGGPALSVSQFADYKPTTTLGLSLTITAPTGLYHADKLLNLGSDRWSFKPELAVSHPFGPEQKWELDTYANAYFFTDHFLSRNGNSPAEDATRTRSTHQLFLHHQPLGLGVYALLVPRRYLRERHEPER